MQRVAPDRLAEEAERALPLLEHDALVPAQGVGVHARVVELGRTLEAPQSARVVLDLREDVARCDPARRVVRVDNHELLCEGRQGRGRAEVPQRGRVELHAVEEVRRDLPCLLERLLGLRARRVSQVIPRGQQRQAARGAPERS